jgi:hypothetical protein
MVGSGRRSFTLAGLATDSNGHGWNTSAFTGVVAFPLLVQRWIPLSSLVVGPRRRRGLEVDIIGMAAGCGRVRCCCRSVVELGLPDR